MKYFVGWYPKSEQGYSISARTVLPKHCPTYDTYMEAEEYCKREAKKFTQLVYRIGEVRAEISAEPSVEYTVKEF